MNVYGINSNAIDVSNIELDKQLIVTGFSTLVETASKFNTLIFILQSPPLEALSCQIHTRQGSARERSKSFNLTLDTKQNPKLINGYLYKVMFQVKLTEGPFEV